MRAVDNPKQARYVERLLSSCLRPVSIALSVGGAGAVVLMFLIHHDGIATVLAPVAAVVLTLIVVLGGIIRAVRSPQSWGLWTGAWSAAAAMAFAVASSVAGGPVAGVLTTLGVVVAIVLTVLVIAAVAARRDRAQLPSRL